MPGALELKLEVPRGQRLVARALLVAFEAGAVLAAWEDGRQGHWGWAAAGALALRLAQGLVVWQAALRLDAKVLVVEQGILTVTTQFRKPFGLGRLDVPIREAALEWIGSSLVVQIPGAGGHLRLGHGPGARSVADWLAARGAPPPVGG